MSRDTIIRQIASKNGVDKTQVEQDMLEAIMVGFNSTDPEVADVWKKICPENKKPSIEDVLNFCAARVLGQKI